MRVREHAIQGCLACVPEQRSAPSVHQRADLQTAHEQCLGPSDCVPVGWAVRERAVGVTLMRARRAPCLSLGTNVHAYIIEDEYLIAQSLQDMLEDLGFTKFSFARSEDAAVFGANQPDFDLITADVRLLPGDGVNAVEKICRERHIPVLFITAYREELEERKPDAAVLQKPVKPEELAAAVRIVLDTSAR